MSPTWRRAPVLVVLLLSVATACDAGDGSGDGDGSGGDDALEGITWVLDRSSVEGLVPDAPADAHVDLRFEGGEASGTAACNSFGGSYTVDGDGLTFGALGATEMACAPPTLMDLEAAFLGALGAVREHAVAGDELVLTGDGVRLTFAPAPVEEPLPLVGTRWRLESLAYGSDTVSSPLAGELPTARFDDAGNVGGSTGCNTYGGRYQVDGEAIAIGEMRVSLRQCASEVAQQEDVFQRALLRAATYAIEGDLLTLSDEAGAFLVSFTGR